jgi:catechol 2,3-dioxygenase-like lactoylglutathione lyase family enzyme
MLRSFPVQPTVATSDIDRGRAFYEGTLGLEPMEESEAGIRFACGAGTTLFLYERPVVTPSSQTVAEFNVTGIDTVVRELASRGVTFFDYDLPTLRTVDHVAPLGPYRAAWFADPDGNLLALNEEAGD